MHLSLQLLVLLLVGLAAGLDLPHWQVWKKVISNVAVYSSHFMHDMPLLHAAESNLTNTVYAIKLIFNRT